jgi:hypothetical protein
MKEKYIKYIYDRMSKADVTCITLDTSAYERLNNKSFLPYKIPILTDINDNNSYYISKIHIPTYSDSLGQYVVMLELFDSENETYEVTLDSSEVDYRTISDLAWVVYKETEEENGDDFFFSLVFGKVFDV